MKLIWFLTAAWSLNAVAANDISKAVTLRYSSDAFIRPTYDLKNATYVGGIGGLPFIGSFTVSVTEYPPTFDFVFKNIQYIKLSNDETVTEGVISNWSCSWWIGQPFYSYLRLSNTDMNIDTSDPPQNSFTINPENYSPNATARIGFWTISLPTTYLRDDLAQISCEGLGTYRTRSNYEEQHQLGFYATFPVITPASFSVTPSVANVKADKNGTFRVNFEITDIPRVGQIVITSNSELTLAGSSGNEWIIKIWRNSSLPKETNKLTISSTITGVSKGAGVKQYTLNFTRHYY